MMRFFILFDSEYSEYVFTVNYIVLFGDLATLASAVNGAYMKPEDIILDLQSLTGDSKSC